MQAANTSMTPRQVALVRESFDKIVPIREQAAALFYNRLFAIDPSTRPLFRGDMKSQGAKLMAAIGAVVKSLDRIDAILDDVRTLARRHHRYGVREERYASVGASLLWAALSREELLMKLGAARDQSVRMAMPMAPPDTLTALDEAGGVMPFATPSSSRPRRPPPELSFSGPHNAVRNIVGHRSDISLLDLGPRRRWPVLTAVPLGGERGASSRSGTVRWTPKMRQVAKVEPCL